MALMGRLLEVVSLFSSVASGGCWGLKGLEESFEGLLRGKGG